MLLCVVLADGFLGLDNVVGKIVFWVAIIFLPIYARRFVKWRYTVINILFLFVLYLAVVATAWENAHYSFFKTGGGWIAIPDWWGAIATTVILWGLESTVYATCNGVSLIKEKRGNRTK